MKTERHAERKNISEMLMFLSQIAKDNKISILWYVFVEQVEMGCSCFRIKKLLLSFLIYFNIGDYEKTKRKKGRLETLKEMDFIMIKSLRNGDIDYHTREKRFKKFSRCKLHWVLQPNDLL